MNRKRFIALLLAFTLAGILLASPALAVQQQQPTPTPYYIPTQLLAQSFGEVGKFFWILPVVLVEPLPNLFGAVGWLAQFGQQSLQLMYLEVVDQGFHQGDSIMGKTRNICVIYAIIIMHDEEIHHKENTRVWQSENTSLDKIRA